jgi:glycosyltransferase involved in cell wall biosynthesis
MRILICSFYFPPSGGGGVQRALKFAQCLPDFGIETRVIAPTDSKWIHRDEPLTGISLMHIYRTRFVGPRGRLPAEELYGTRGAERLWPCAALFPRRLLVPDENVTWALTAVPAISRIVRRERPDFLLTTSPPNSVHLIGAAVKRLVGIRWVADVRDSVVAHPDRRIESFTVRLKEQTQRLLARQVVQHADAIVAVTPRIAAEFREPHPNGPVVTISNGADFDDFAGLSYRPGSCLPITHRGSFFGQRDPRPFLTALAGVDSGVVARFLGDFRRNDLDWVRANGLQSMLELIPFAPRRRALELQRESDVLLLLLPEVGEGGRDVPSGKLYEYLAARRPILAAIPPNGTAAELIREANARIIVAPDDAGALCKAIEGFVARRQQVGLPDLELPPGFEERIARTERVRELAELLRDIPPART